VLSYADSFVATGAIASARLRSTQTAGPDAFTRGVSGMHAAKLARDIRAAFGGEVRLPLSDSTVTNDFPNVPGAKAWRPPA
jgi:hypothetical protein